MAILRTSYENPGPYVIYNIQEHFIHTGLPSESPLIFGGTNIIQRLYSMGAHVIIVLVKTIARYSYLYVDNVRFPIYGLKDLACTLKEGTQLIKNWDMKVFIISLLPMMENTF